MEMPLFLKPFNKKIESLCYRYKVVSLYCFGSVLTEKFNDNSDIDLIADFDMPFDVGDYRKNLIQLKNEFQKLFNRPVDLLEEKRVKNPVIRQGVEKKKLQLFPLL